VYRSTRVLNFAQGELGTVPAFLVLMLLTSFDLSATVDPAALSLTTLTAYALVGVFLGALLAVGINALVIQRLQDASPVTTLVATAVVSLLFIGAQFVIFGLQVRRFPRMLEGTLCFVRGDEVCLLQTNRHNLVILFVLVVAASLLALLFRTELGTALLAVAQDPYAASLHGVSPRAMSSLAWGIGGALAALGGILGAGFFDLSPGLMTTTFLIPAFTAAVLGGITSMTGAVVGGIILGLVAALANGITSTYGLSNVIPSPPTLASFTVLLLVLLVRPRGLFGKEA
jgi:branched-chain amino acid transport system permease protein